MANIVGISKENVLDFQEIPNPGNPPVGIIRLYCDSGSGEIAAIDSNGDSAFPGSGGSLTWNSLTNATGTLTLANSTYGTTFNQTSAVTWEWANTTAATLSTPQSSPALVLAGTYWNGSASAADSFTIQGVPGSGSNPLSVLSITHSGSSGGGELNWQSGAFIITNGGSILGTGNVGAGVSSSIYWNGRAHMLSPADGEITLAPNAGSGNAFTRLQFGGTSASFPALAPQNSVATGVSAVLADGSANTTFLASAYYAGSGAGTVGVSAGSFSAITAIQTIGGIVTTLTGSSDERLKENIEPYSGGLAAILAINPKRYSWNAEGQRRTKFKPGQRFIGFIAQNVAEGIPEAVGFEDGFLSLDTRPILAALVNAVKELNAKILELEGVA